MWGLGWDGLIDRDTPGTGVVLLGLRGGLGGVGCGMGFCLDHGAWGARLF